MKAGSAESEDRSLEFLVFRWNMKHALHFWILNYEKASKKGTYAFLAQPTPMSGEEGFRAPVHVDCR